MQGLIADRRLWLDAQKKKVVEDGDPKAAFLLCAKGQLIPASEVKRLKLTANSKGKISQGAKKKAKPKSSEKSEKQSSGESKKE